MATTDTDYRKAHLVHLTQDVVGPWVQFHSCSNEPDPKSKIAWDGLPKRMDGGLASEHGRSHRNHQSHGIDRTTDAERTDSGRGRRVR